MGVDLFYHVLTFLAEENLHFLPAKQLFTICLEQLGQVSKTIIYLEIFTMQEKIMHLYSNLFIVCNI